MLLKRMQEVHNVSVKQPEVLQQAIVTFGEEAQIDIAIEEMSELTKALLKERRATNYQGSQVAEIAKRDINEEMADVIIMIAQLLIIFDNQNMVQKITDKKVERLSQRIIKQIRNEEAADALAKLLQNRR